MAAGSGKAIKPISTHSRAKAAGKFQTASGVAVEFQLTAARRRLAVALVERPLLANISTHSRAKAAGAAAETLNPQGLHRPVSLRFH